MDPSVVIQHDINLDPELPPEIKKLAIQQGEDDLTRTHAIGEFRNYILEHNECQPHRMDDEFLIKFLRARHWKLQDAHKLLCNYCTFRNDNKSYHEKVKPRELVSLGEKNILSSPPYRDQKGRRILIHRFGCWDPSEVSADDVFRATILMIELGSLEPITQVAGGVSIFDLKDLSLKHIMQLSPSVAQKILALIVTSMPLRTNELHIVNQNWAFNTAYSLFSPFLSAAMKKNLYIHGSDMSSLHKYMDPNRLPKRYGGIHDDYAPSFWTEKLENNKKVTAELESLGYIMTDAEIA